MTDVIHAPALSSPLPTGWRWSRLQDVCTVFDCPHSTPQFTSEGPYIVRSQDIRAGVFSRDSAARVTEQTYLDRTLRAAPSHGDLLFSREGTYFGIAAEVPAETKVCLGQRMVLLRPTPHVLDFRFLKYWLNSPIMVQHVRGFRDGSVAERLNVPTIKSLAIVLPPIREQQFIAESLSVLDQKIELNRCMNQTLEAIARVIFKSWFVDFAPVRIGGAGRKHSAAQFFPGDLVPSTVGYIPRGWHVRQLGAIVDLEKGLSYKGRFLSASGMPMVNLGCFRGQGRFAPEGLKFYSGDYRERHVVRPGDLVIANTDITQKREILGSPAIIPESGHDLSLFTHHVFAIRFKADKKLWAPYVYHALLEPEFRDRARGFATGTTVLALPKDAVLDHLVLDPGPIVLNAFAELVHPLRQRMNLNWDTSNTLLKIREMLLPKLLSGEIRVKEGEGIVEVPA